MEAGTGPLNPSSTEKKSAPKEAKPNKLMAALEAVQADVASLRDAFNKSQIQAPARDEGKGEKRSFRRRSCNVCQDMGQQQCNHCYKCGSEEHFARGCKKNFNQENTRGLQSRDRV